MVYTKITIDTTVEAIDMVSYTLSELGVEGIEIDDKIPLTEEEKEAMYIDIMPEPTEEYDGFAKISCYIPMGNEEAEGIRNTGITLCDAPVLNIPELLANIRMELDRLSEFMDVGPKTIAIDESDDADWLNKWKDYFKPFKLEENIIIKPSWEVIEDVRPEDIVIEIDPGIAFGTGSHNTTKLCIAQLKKYVTEDSTVLDAGCGSGILSMIALKLGAKRALGIDIDEIAVKVSAENRQMNDLTEEQFQVRIGDVIGDSEFAATITEQYDIVVANILADVIIPLSAVVAPFMKENGVFISSGIIDNREDEVREALLENNFDIIETTYMGDWVSFTAKKRG